MTSKDLKHSINTLFVLLLSLTFISCYGDSQDSPPGQTSSTTPAVEAVQARHGSLPLSQRLSGTVVADNQVTLYPEMSGRVSEVHVRTGDSVEKGDPLVSLSNRQYQEQLNQAKANHRINQARLKQAQASYNELSARYERAKKLNERDLSSEQEMETLQAELASAEADVQLAEAQVQQSAANVEEQEEILSQTVIRAPIAGTVGQRNAEVGMQVSSSQQLFTIGDLDNLRVEVVLTDGMLSEVEIGQTAQIYVGEDQNQQILEAELSRISPFLNNVTRSTEGEIDIQNENNLLRPGMFVAVDIMYGESEEATLLPTSAIYNNPATGEDGVFIATALGTEIEPAEQENQDNPAPLTEATEVQFKEIDIIAEGRMEVAVSDIEPGSWVVTVGQDLLSEGRSQARVRTSTWERILAMQGLQRQDLLQQVLDVQQ